MSIYVDTHETSKISDDELINKITSNIDLTPRGIRDHLNLHKPIYKSAAYGHFGREPNNDGSFSWEKTDIANKFKFLLTKEINVQKYYRYRGRKTSKKISKANLNLLKNFYEDYSYDREIIEFLSQMTKVKDLIGIQIIILK